MALTRAQAAGIIRPEDVGNVLVKPLRTRSIALTAFRTVTTASATYRIPLVESDGVASWVGELDEIVRADPEFGEHVVTPQKLAKGTTISRELAKDSSPSAQAQVGDSLAAALAKSIDLTAFGTGATGIAGAIPSGLATLDDVSEVTVSGTIANLDPFVDAAAAVQNVGGAVTSWVVNPTDAAALAKLRSATGSNLPLLATDPTQPSRRTVEGAPLLVTPAVPAGTIYGIDGDRTFAVIREDVLVEADGSVEFWRDAVAVRATMRVGFGFPHPEAIVRITSGS